MKPSNPLPSLRAKYKAFSVLELIVCFAIAFICVSIITYMGSCHKVVKEKIKKQEQFMKGELPENKIATGNSLQLVYEIDGVRLYRVSDPGTGAVYFTVPSGSTSWYDGALERQRGVTGTTIVPYATTNQ